MWQAIFVEKYFTKAYIFNMRVYAVKLVSFLKAFANNFTNTVKLRYNKQLGTD